MNRFSKALLKGKEDIEKYSIHFNLSNNKDKELFMFGYDIATNNIIEELKREVNEEVVDSVKEVSK